MNDADYERERIRTIYGDTTAEAGAQRDQALAALYHRSGWTQEELAKVEGCTRTIIARRLAFGRFLGNVPSGHNPRNLTERRFRNYWEQTEKTGNERIRFAAVLRLMQEELAKVEGCKRQQIARRLTFGRFLAFTPSGSNPRNLTECRFRSYWEQTEKTGNERIRSWLCRGAISPSIRRPPSPRPGRQ